MGGYYPMIEGRVLEYALSDAEGRGTLRVAFSGVQRRGKRAVARVTQTAQRGDDAPQTFAYDASVDEKGVITSAWGLEFPLPLQEGLVWTRGAADFRVESLTGRKLVPAGDFKNCLELSFLIAAGDGGGGRRFYAPGVGLIYALSSDETDPFEYALKRII